ncbi:MAG: BrnA antitoxin family protein, partial [Deltaproteobacteria bacterium]|nr:BrnA antitoxin family protein [Deltaproteobacteria bacterium]
EFWATADSTEYINWEKTKKTVFPNLKPSLKKISLRLPQLIIEKPKVLANKRDIPYQSLENVLAERIDQELRSTSR